MAKRKIRRKRGRPGKKTARHAIAEAIRMLHHAKKKILVRAK
jgi:hypothetical protein